MKQKIFLVMIFSLCSFAISLYAQPVRTVPAADNNKSKPVAKPKRTVVKVNQDSDGDGLVDNADKCPYVYGPPSNKGCPEEKKRDRDNDGIPDETDACPDDAGLSTANGCPPRASLKIVSDVHAKLYVDGVLKIYITKDAPYILKLGDGYFDIRVESAENSKAFELKKGYKVENFNQQDYWNVVLKDDEAAQLTLEKQRLEQRSQALLNLVKNCMITRFKPRGYQDRQYYLVIKNDKLEFHEHIDDQELSSGKMIKYSDSYQTIDINTISRFESSYSAVTSWMFPSHYKLLIYGDVNERYENYKRNEFSTSKPGYMSIEVRDDCAEQLVQQLSKLFEK